VIEDIVRQLGYLTLGSRLKRLGERLQSQAQALLEEAGPAISASYFPLLAALDRLGALTVGELSQALGITQPGVTRLLDKLESEDLVNSQATTGDRRVRSVVLSPAGRQMVERSKKLAWSRIEAAVADACAGPKRPLLAQLAALEDALTAVPLRERVTRVSTGE
jgi:DNA-binding MarR family transcriptional regulator